MLMTVITFWFKWLNKSLTVWVNLAMTGERKIHVWHDVNLSASLSLKRAYAWIWPCFRGGFQHVWQSQKSYFNRQLMAINFLFHLACMNLIIFVIWAGQFWKKLALHQCWQTTKKGIFLLKRAFLGESQRPVSRLSNQILSLRLETL